MGPYFQLSRLEAEILNRLSKGPLDTKDETLTSNPCLRVTITRLRKRGFPIATLERKWKINNRVFFYSHYYLRGDRGAPPTGRADAWREGGARSPDTPAAH